MSFSSIAAVVAGLMLASDASAASGLSCPRYRHGMKLSAYSVFDGTPSHRADLKGDGNGWDLTSPPTLPGESYHLVCDYQGEKLELVIPATVKHCKAHGTLTTPAIACQ